MQRRPNQECTERHDRDQQLQREVPARNSKNDCHVRGLAMHYLTAVSERIPHRQMSPLKFLSREALRSVAMTRTSFFHDVKRFCSRDTAALARAIGFFSTSVLVRSIRLPAFVLPTLPLQV